MYWRWTARKLGISAFLAVHLTSILVINMPDGALKQRIVIPVAWYLIPIGLDQAWGMFAPNPILHPMELEVLAVDRNGIQRTFAFPKMTDFGFWEAIPKVRHSKFASNCGVAQRKELRECAVRYALRQLKIPPEAFPVEAELLYQVRETPPPGEPLRDPMKPTVPSTLQSYRFEKMVEVLP